MDKRQRFMRYVVVWEGSHDRYLQRILPSGHGQWTRHLALGTRYASATDAEKTAAKMEKKLRKQGIKTTVSYRLVQNGLDDFFHAG